MLPDLKAIVNEKCSYMNKDKITGLLLYKQITDNNKWSRAIKGRHILYQN